MRVFPQIGSGSPAQFPFLRRVSYRSARNSLPDGFEFHYNDPAFEERRWQLSLEGLNDEEWNRINDLFMLCNGRLESFLFLEPGANLLKWSANIDASDWTKSVPLTIEDGRLSPSGEFNASRIVAGVAGSFSQSLAIPADFAYAASCSMRTSHSGVTLRIQDDNGTQSIATPSPDNTWQRCEAAIKGQPGGESINWVVDVPAGAELEIYGAQIEAQLGPSSYKQTGERSGVFEASRFDQDELPDRLTGPGAHAGEVTIVWTPLLS